MWVAVRITPKAGWHTYWKNPGDAGLPPSLAWSFPTSASGWKTGELQWPAPERIQVKRLASYGYSGAVLLPQQLFAPPKLPHGAHTLNVRVDWLVCEESCIPQEAQLSLTLQAEPGTPRVNQSNPSPASIAITQALSSLPTNSPSIQASAQRVAGVLQVTLRGLSSARGELFIEQEDIVEPGPVPQTNNVQAALQWRAPLGSKGKQLKAPSVLDAVWVPKAMAGQAVTAQRFLVQLNE